MSTVHSFTFNPFLENTYVVFDETGSCIIIDPGTHSREEQLALSEFIESNKLRVDKVINTHCHVDHVFGNEYATQTFKAGLYIHKEELPMLKAFKEICNMWGIAGDQSPDPAGFIEDGDTVVFGNTSLRVMLTPGHSPGSISFYCDRDDYIIAGDVLFQGGIGRTDLLGGNYDTLISSITNKLMLLNDKVIVYPGHGPPTTIGIERVSNPFIT